MANLANLLPNVVQQFRDSNGNVLAGGKLYSYQAGTSTPLETYTDSTEDPANANPIVLDSTGSANIWIGSSAYKFVLKDSNSNTIWTVDNVQWINDGYITSTMIAAGAVGTDQLADASIPTSKLQDASVTSVKLSASVSGGLSPVGATTMFHTFNGTLSVPRGWMILNGNIVNSTNYDAIHGAGAWAIDGGSSSSLSGKYLPDMTSRFPIGVASTSQDGSVAITAVGNSGNTVNLSHHHTMPAHNHTWYVPNTGSSDNSYDPSFGTGLNLTDGSPNNTGVGIVIASKDGSSHILNQQLGTVNSTVGLTGGSSLSTTQSIKPDSIELIYIMKVI